MSSEKNCCCLHQSELDIVLDRLLDDDEMQFVNDAIRSLVFVFDDDSDTTSSRIICRRRLIDTTESINVTSLQVRVFVMNAISDCDVSIFSETVSNS